MWALGDHYRKHGMEIIDLLSLFATSDLPNYTLYQGKDVEIWVDKKDEVITQVLVYGSFAGTFEGRFGIGSFLSEIEEYTGQGSYEVFNGERKGLY